MLSADVRQKHVRAMRRTVPRDGAELIRRGMRVEFLVLAISPISAPFLSTRREGVVSMRIPFSYSSVRPMDDKF